MFIPGFVYELLLLTLCPKLLTSYIYSLPKEEYIIFNLGSHTPITK
jgi:hypothetical protein